jgi:hypothetical protein
MNASNENQEPANLDQQHDRLLDIALREVVGNEAAKDLTPRILAATLNPAAASVAAPTQAAPPPPRTRKRAFWATLAVAAMLLVGASLALLPALQSSRQAARKYARASRLGNSVSRQPTIASENKSPVTRAALPSAYYFDEDLEAVVSSRPNQFSVADAGANADYAGVSAQGGYSAPGPATIAL